MSTEIKNIVFDMGNVLLDYSPENCLGNYFPDEDDFALVKRVIWASGDWDKLDAGQLTDDEALARWLAVLPARLHEPTREMFLTWHERMPPIDGMTEFVRELKANGYRCYLLSNASLRFPLYKDTYEVLTLLDGHFVSSFYRMAKPDPAIYRKLFETFSLDPAECFFVDDREVNVNASRSVGMRAYQHKTYDIEALRTAMREEGIRI